jgi:sugar phosphate isomerase/epimerase
MQWFKLRRNMERIDVSACATLAYSQSDLITAVDRIRDLGFKKIEITELGAYCRHLPFPDTSLIDIAGWLEKKGLSVIGINVSTARLVDGLLMRYSMGDPLHRDHILTYCRWFIDAAVHFGASFVAFPPAPREFDNWSVAAAAAAKVFKELAEYAEKRGTMVYIEAPHLFQIQDSVDHSLEFLLQLGDSPIGIIIDTSHWGIIGYDLAAYINEIDERPFHIHLRDSAGSDTRDFKQNLEMTPGNGTVDFDKFRRILVNSGRSFTATLELEYRTNDEDYIGSEITRGITYLKSCGFSFPT